MGHRAILLLAILSGLMGCAGPRPLLFPVDPGGQGLNSPFGENSPRISGRYLVFTSDRRGSQNVYLFDLREQRLLELPGLNSADMVVSSPTVSEDGRYLAFAGSRAGRTGIYFYDRELRSLRNLTENLQAEVRNPTMTADGSEIAFEASTNGQWDILLYNRAGQPLPVPTEPR